MRATLSGANLITIIDKDIRTPNGLAIDHKSEKIYFSDATLDKIERCEYDGSQRQVSWFSRTSFQGSLGTGGSKTIRPSCLTTVWIKPLATKVGSNIIYGTFC